MNPNQYNSIRETFVTNDLHSVNPLSTAAVPPNDLTLDATTRTAVANGIAYAYTTAGGAIGRFATNDVPIIRGLGAFCNMGDCLVDISSKSYSTANGLCFTMEWLARTAAGATITSLIPAASRPIWRFNEFNAIFEEDFSLLPFASNMPITDATYDHTVLRFEFTGSSATYSTILLDPAFQTKRFGVWMHIVIEHSAQLSTTAV